MPGEALRSEAAAPTLEILSLPGSSSDDSREESFSLGLERNLKKLINYTPVFSLFFFFLTLARNCQKSHLPFFKDLL